MKEALTNEKNKKIQPEVLLCVPFVGLLLVEKAFFCVTKTTVRPRSSPALILHARHRLRPLGEARIDETPER